MKMHPLLFALYIAACPVSGLGLIFFVHRFLNGV